MGVAKTRTGGKILPMSSRKPRTRTASQDNLLKASVDKHMRKAMALADSGMRRQLGGPFGAVIVKGGKLIGSGCNCVTSANDPTAHAEIVAIRDACQRLKTFDLSGAVIYSSCEPCPMCLAAIYWARLGEIIYAGTRRDAAQAGFADDFLYEELARPLARRKIPIRQMMRRKAQALFAVWNQMPARIQY
jgi:guanine deaminase